jgi:MATE family multidrug resistance protein
MVSSEWWAWEGLSLSVSLLGPVALAVNSILLSFSSILFQVPQSMGIATAVRVGNLLGSGRAYEARLAAILALILSLGTSVFNRYVPYLAPCTTFLLIFPFSALLIIFRNKVAYIFNSDPEVVLEVGKVTIYVAAFQVRTTPDAKTS